MGFQTLGGGGYLTREAIAQLSLRVPATATPQRSRPSYLCRLPKPVFISPARLREIRVRDAATRNPSP